MFFSESVRGFAGDVTPISRTSISVLNSLFWGPKGAGSCAATRGITDGKNQQVFLQGAAV